MIEEDPPPASVSESQRRRLFAQKPALLLKLFARIEEVEQKHTRCACEQNCGRCTYCAPASSVPWPCDALQGWYALRDISIAWLTSGLHDERCHPSEQRHSDDCRWRHLLLADIADKVKP